MNHRAHNLGLVLACLLLWLCTIATNAQSLDSSFTPPVAYRAGETFLMKKAPKEKVYLAGDFDFHGERQVGQLVRLTPSGFLDTSFNPDLPRNCRVRNFDVLPNGNIVVIVEYETKGSTEVYVLAVNGRRIKKIQFYEDPMTVRALPDNRFLIGYASGGLVLVTRNLNLDKTFRYSAKFADGIISDIELQGSQAIVVGWFNNIFDSVENRSVFRKSLARINLDGTIDPAFSFENYNVHGIPSILVQPDGKIIPLNGPLTDSTRIKPMRLHRDGAQDPSFNYTGDADDFIKDASYDNGWITILTENKILRLRDDGSVDPTFTQIRLDRGNVKMLVLSDRSLLVANREDAIFGLEKLTVSGEVVSETYKAQLMRYGIINSVDQTGHALYVGGDFIKINKHFTQNLAKLSPSGKVDQKFVASINHVVQQVKCLANGKVVASASQDIFKVKGNGEVDPAFSFDPPEKFSGVREFIVQENGRILVGAPGALLRVDSSGAVDRSFKEICCNEDSSSEFDIDVDPETKKILVAGKFDSFNGIPIKNLARLNADGKLDTGFHFKNAQPEFGVRKVLVLNDGQVLLSSENKYLVNEEPFHILKLDANAVAVEQFLINYQGHTPQGQRRAYSLLHYFNGAIIMGVNDPQEGYVGQIINDDGKAGTNFSISKEIKLHSVNTFFSANDLELFIGGQVSVGETPQKYQLVKILNDNPGVLAVRPVKK